MWFNSGMETTQTTALEALAAALAGQKTCECGCGQAVARRFLPGHDARLKSALVQSVAAGSLCAREAAAQALLDRGWLHFAKVEDLAALPMRTRASNGRFTESRHMEVVMNANWTHLDQAKVTHAHPDCGDVQGRCKAERQPTGWLCSTCVHTDDWADLATLHAKEAHWTKTPARSAQEWSDEANAFVEVAV